MNTCFCQRVTRCVVMAGMLAASSVYAAPRDVQMTLKAGQPGALVHREIFGQFAEDLGASVYGGIWVGEHSSIPNTEGYRTDVLKALQALDVPVVRWPGGCFADRYHWRDGVGPRDQRPTTENAFWGAVDDNNAFGTAEFMRFSQLIGAQAFIAGNVGSAPPEELSHWVQYMTSTSHSRWARLRRKNGRKKPWKLAYLGIGNELWGCGGNMTATYAAHLFRRYQTFVHIDGQQHTQKIAPGANGDDSHWIKVMMQVAGTYMDGIGLHYYTIPGSFEHKQSATRFNESGWIETLSKALHMDALITKDSAIMDRFDPDKRVALDVDEWGTWYKAQPGTNPAFLRQQNTLRDAMVAALTLNIFVQHADRVRMANIAQMVNVLQSMILTRGKQMVLTPTYYVFKMYKPYQDANALPLTVSTPTYRHGKYSVPAVQATAVRGKDGHVYIAMTNLDPQHQANVSMHMHGVNARRVSGHILTAAAMNAKNTFKAPQTIKPAPFHHAHIHGDSLGATLPAKSIVFLELK